MSFNIIYSAWFIIIRSIARWWCRSLYTVCCYRKFRMMLEWTAICIFESVSASYDQIRDYDYFQDSCGTHFRAFDDSENTWVFKCCQHSSHHVFSLSVGRSINSMNYPATPSDLCFYWFIWTVASIVIWLRVFFLPCHLFFRSPIIDCLERCEFSLFPGNRRRKSANISPPLHPITPSMLRTVSATSGNRNL